MTSICILGKCSKNRYLAPFEDEKIKFWCISQENKPRAIARANLVFEMHSEPKFRERLSKFTCPAITTDNYPYKEVEAMLVKHNACKDYIMSSIGYMLAMAIIDKSIDIIYLYGVDMASNEEYGYQRPNTEFLLGVASGIGKKVILPDNTSLLRSVAKYGTAEHNLEYFKDKKPLITNSGIMPTKA